MMDSLPSPTLILAPPSQWRLELAQKIAPLIAANPKVQAIMLAGSASRNSSDAHSDIEIGVFWSAPPSPAERDVYIEAAGGTFWERDPYNEAGRTWMDEWGLGNLKMDMRHMTLAGVEDVLTAVLDHHHTDAFNQVTLAALQYAIPLYNAPLIARWQARLTPYPAGLRLAMVRENMFLTSLWQLEVYAYRAEWPLLYEELTGVTQQILRMLIGLNGLYYPGLKWLTRLVGELTLAPSNLHSRLEQIFQSPPLSAAQTVGQLALETYDLLEHHLPEVESRETRAAFLKRREPFEQAPRMAIG